MNFTFTNANRKNRDFENVTKVERDASGRLEIVYENDGTTKEVVLPMGYSLVAAWEPDQETATPRKH